MKLTKLLLGLLQCAALVTLALFFYWSEYIDHPRRRAVAEQFCAPAGLSTYYEARNGYRCRHPTTGAVSVPPSEANR